ncbi:MULTISPECIES: cytochrome oxidase small assembly protein [unclassified Roseateles]|nr:MULTISPECIES: cytochrome oxidase small assembly protein [unclassified Roseateles]
MTPEQRKSNRRLGLILLTIALAFGVGFIAKIVLLSP